MRNCCLRSSTRLSKPLLAGQRNDLPESQRGIYVEVVSRKNEPLATDKLERNDIELLLVKHLPDETRATLFVPASAKAVYSDVVEKYRTRNSALSKTNAPLNRPLVEAIAEFRLAALKELWADDPDLFPADGTAFHWETWLRQGTVERFRSAAQKLGMAVGPGGLSFPETTVVRVTATPEQMAILIGESLCVAEVRAIDSLGAGSSMPLRRTF